MRFWNHQMYQQAGEQTFLLESRGDANHKLLDDDRFVLTEFRLNCIGAPTRSSLKQTKEECIQWHRMADFEIKVPQ